VRLFAGEGPVDLRPEAVCFVLVLDPFRLGDFREWVRARRWVAVLLLLFGCGHAGEVGDLGAAEIDSVESELPVLRRETFAFRHDRDRLVGELSLPDAPPPYPAVVFVHGSGPATRHMEYLESIAREFLGRGFATLIWSKPGIDESTGHYLKQTMADRAAEVAAAIAQLAERPDIDGDRIGLWGISQAGWVMPMVPDHRKVAFAISVSGSAQTGQQQDLYGAANELRRIGFSDAELADAIDHRLEFYELIHEELPYEEFLLRQRAWLAAMKARPWFPTLESQLDDLKFQDFVISPEPDEYEFFTLNDRGGSLVSPPELKKLDMPVLAIYGSADALVDSKRGADAYREIPALNGNPDVTVVVFEGADHGIRQRDDNGHLDLAPGYLATMGEWLSEHR
jgi:pimeloyl-ACP methyl ester carboxylesterase